MITKVRERDSREAGFGDTCHCGAAFFFVVERDDKNKAYFWCSRCDQVRKKK